MKCLNEEKNLITVCDEEVGGLWGIAFCLAFCAGTGGLGTAVATVVGLGPQ